MFSVDHLLTAIAAAVLGEALYETFKVPVAVIKTLTSLKRVKPLDCAKCLAFWSGVGFFVGGPIEVSGSVMSTMWSGHSMTKLS